MQRIEHPLDTPCRTAYRTESWAIPSLWRVTPPGASGHLAGLVGSLPIPSSRALSCVTLEPRPLRSTGVTRLHRYYGPIRHLARPGLLLAEFRLRVTHPHRRGFPCCLSFPLSCMPPPLPRWDRSGAVAHLAQPTSAFPVSQAGRLPHYPFRGLLGVHSRCGLPAR